MTPHQSDPHPLVGPSSWRLALAFSLFLSLLGSSLWWVIQHTTFLTGTNRDKRSMNSSLNRQQEADHRFFYQRIGTAPLFDPPPGYHAQSLEDELESLLMTTTKRASGLTKPKDAILPEAYTIEVIASTDQDEAEKMVRSLKKNGIQAFYTPLLSNDSVIYRVRIGIFESQESAEKKLSMIKKHLRNPASVTVLR